MQGERRSDDPPFYRVVLPLAAAETIVWAAYYYSFPALLLIWERDLGWSKAELSGAFTLSLIASAAMAPIVGRAIDRGYAKEVFAGSAAFAAFLLATLATVSALWQFYLVWIGLGVAMAGSLYEACFAVLTRAFGSSAKRGITAVALIAGFAGTVSFPTAHLLSGWFGWRSAVLVFAAAVMVVAVPLIWMSCKAAELRLAVRSDAASLPIKSALSVTQLPAFWWLVLLFAMIALGHGTLLTHLLPILDERGITADLAVLAASLIGPMQVFGRLVMTTIGRHAATRTIFTACLIATSLAAMALLGAGASPTLLFGFVVLQGAGYGVTSIVRPVFVAERLGRENFGTISGLLAMAYVGGSALAPTIAALLWGLGGYDLVIWFAMAASAMGLISLGMAARHPHEERSARKPS